MSIKNVDDCIRKIELDDGTNLFEKNNSKCSASEGYDYNSPFLEQIPYEIGQNIHIIVGDAGGTCGFRIDIKVNNNAIKNDDIKFWDCDNCLDYYYNNTNEMINCFPPQSHQESNNYNFYFNISSLDQFDFDTSEYLYYLNITNYIYIFHLLILIMK